MLGLEEQHGIKRSTVKVIVLRSSQSGGRAGQEIAIIQVIKVLRDAKTQFIQITTDTPGENFTKDGRQVSEVTEASRNRQQLNYIMSYEQIS